MRAHELGGDRKPKPGAAGAGRTLERLEQMRARLFGKTGTGIGNLDHDHRAFTAAGDADLVASWIAVGTAFGGLAFHGLHGIAGKIKQDAEQLIVVGLHDESALDGADPADRCVGAEA